MHCTSQRKPSPPFPKEKKRNETKNGLDLLPYTAHIDGKKIFLRKCHQTLETMKYTFFR